ncbi:MAG: SHOCT domain-containing protein, partial [Ruminococcus sp.]|nr:SHOCT domain-containing protein [Ruminococcus sp.]
AQANTIQSPQQTSIDDLKRYKELLDSGAITEEEYESKKKQLLNI